MLYNRTLNLPISKAKNNEIIECLFRSLDLGISKSIHIYIYIYMYLLSYFILHMSLIVYLYFLNDNVIFYS